MKCYAEELIAYPLTIIALVALGYAGMYAMDKQAETDQMHEAEYRAEHARQVRECNQMVGSHRRACLDEVKGGEV